MTEIEPTEIGVEAQEEGVDLQKFVSIFRRRHLEFFLPFLVGWLVVWGASWLIPAKYTSNTVILLESPNMPKDYVASNVGEDLQSRMQSITEQILNRTRLLAIIDKFHLYGGGGTATPDAKVERMRKDILVELVHGEDSRLLSGFAVSYTSQSPQMAQQVTNDLTDLFIDENVKMRQQASQDTTNFLQSQLDNARANLSEQDARIKGYEAQHEGELPSQQTANMQVLGGLQTQLQSEMDALNNARHQEDYDREMVNQLSGPDGVAGQIGPGTVASLDAELDQMRTRLTDLTSRYTEKYPDVVHLKREIARTEKQRDELQAKEKAGGGAAAASKPALHATSPALAQAQSQLVALSTEIASRQKAVDALKAKVVAYQERLNSTPLREQELNNLTRDSEQMKADYDQLLKKKSDSEMATSMEQMQQGERFIMVDPPSLPSTPSSPNRIKLCGIGLAVGFALGLLVVVGLEFKEGKLYSEGEIMALLPMAVLAEIPEIEIDRDRGLKRRRSIVGWAVAVSVILIVATGSAFTFLHG